VDNSTRIKVPTKRRTTTSNKNMASRPRNRYFFSPHRPQGSKKPSFSVPMHTHKHTHQCCTRCLHHLRFALENHSSKADRAYKQSHFLFEWKKHGSTERSPWRRWL